jgi:hypothetical protein
LNVFGQRMHKLASVRILGRMQEDRRRRQCIAHAIIQTHVCIDLAVLVCFAVADNANAVGELGHARRRAARIGHCRLFFFYVKPSFFFAVEAGLCSRVSAATALGFAKESASDGQKHMAQNDVDNLEFEASEDESSVTEAAHRAGSVPRASAIQPLNPSKNSAAGRSELDIGQYAGYHSYPKRVYNSFCQRQVDQFLPCLMLSYVMASMGFGFARMVTSIEKDLLFVPLVVATLNSQPYAIIFIFATGVPTLQLCCLLLAIAFPDGAPVCLWKVFSQRR